jgi:hypothetical protein
MSLTVDASGNVTGETKVITFQGGCAWTPARITGRADGGKLLLVIEGDELAGAVQRRGGATLILAGAAPASPPAAAPAAAQPNVAAVAPAGPSASPDGLWRGTYACTSAGRSPSYTLDLKLRIANGTSSGGGVLPTSSNDRSMDISVSVNPPSVTVTRTFLLPGTNPPPAKNSLTGQFDGTSIRASGRYDSASGGYASGGSAYDCTLTLTRG